jgi:steroid 5-alpha reductase family enzyme
MIDFQRGLEIYKNLFLFQFPWMTAAWLICVIRNNGSMVDFAWPSGFFIMALQFALSGEGNDFCNI